MTNPRFSDNPKIEAEVLKKEQMFHLAIVALGSFGGFFLNLFLDTIMMIEKTHSNDPNDKNAFKPAGWAVVGLFSTALISLMINSIKLRLIYFKYNISQKEEGTLFFESLRESASLYGNSFGKSFLVCKVISYLFEKENKNPAKELFGPEFNNRLRN